MGDAFNVPSAEWTKGVSYVLCNSLKCTCLALFEIDSYKVGAMHFFNVHSMTSPLKISPQHTTLSLLKRVANMYEYVYLYIFFYPKDQRFRLQFDVISPGKHGS